MDDAIAAVRRFNRFFTRYVGVLDSDFLKTGMSLGEARILYEIAHRAPCFADALQHELDLDGGFVSRVIQRFETRKWIARTRSESDGRRRTIALTALGRKHFTAMDEKQQAIVAQNLAALRPEARERLVHALGIVQTSLEQKPAAPVIALRPFRAGDLGLIASRQAILYRDTFGWSAGIEVNIGEAATAFLRDFKPGREQCWIAEVDGALAGSVLVTDEGDGLARLRLLYVEPEFHRLGIGDRLVATCLDFAQRAGYRRIQLWTHSILTPARTLYAKHGFRIVSTKPHTTFGVELMGETWERALIDDAALGPRAKK